jgi:hypothetical protein
MEYTKEQIEKMYQDSRPFIDKAVSQIIRKNHINDKEDVLSEASMLFMECATKFSEEKGNFQHFLNKTLSRELPARIMRNEGHQIHNVNCKRECFYNADVSYEFVAEHKEEIFTEEHDRPFTMNETVELVVNNLSEDARIIAEAIIAPPRELLLLNYNVGKASIDGIRILQKDVFQYFRKVKNWKRSRILESFKEIKSTLNQVWA